MASSIVIHLIPPPQTNHQPPSDVLQMERFMALLRRFWQILFTRCWIWILFPRFNYLHKSLCNSVTLETESSCTSDLQRKTRAIIQGDSTADLSKTNKKKKKGTRWANRSPEQKKHQPWPAHVRTKGSQQLQLCGKKHHILDTAEKMSDLLSDLAPDFLHALFLFQ